MNERTKRRTQSPKFCPGPGFPNLVEVGAEKDEEFEKGLRGQWLSSAEITFSVIFKERKTIYILSFITPDSETKG